MSALQTTRFPQGGTSRRSPHAIAATVIGVVCAACLVGSTWVTVLNGGAREGLGELLVLLLALYAYLVVGLFIYTKTPRNPLGWAMIGVGVLTSVGSFAGEIAEYAYTPPGNAVVGATFAAWINEWWWYPTMALVFMFVPLLFPNGTPLTPRWRWVTRTAVGLLALIMVVTPLSPVLKGDTYKIPNPIGVAAAGDIEKSALGDAIFFLLVTLTLLALISLILRFRRSRGVERLQMKWFVFGAVVIIFMITLEEVLKALKLDHLLPDSNVAFGIGVAALPVAIGIAVLKYRLYDIDRIISRTLSYAVLTALLLGLYLGAVAAVTTVTAPFAEDSAIAVAAATLLAAAAFGPARRRIQGVVDRRFNRARYDAERTVATLRGRLRDEIDLATLTTELVTAINDSVQPQGTVLWLRDSATAEGRT